uniref:Uncharacterized protein n=1 Tax=Trichogramma kaykai TaxID=54128 RepID=A0ABD2XFT0_9HYME
MSKRPLYYIDYSNYVKKRSNTILKSRGEILEADSRLDVEIECDIDNIDKEIFQKHYYCEDCLTLSNNDDLNSNNDESIEIEEISDNLVSCDCNKDKYFIEISLMRQLELLYQRPGFYNKLRQRDHTRPHDVFEDITDGSIYKDLKNDGGILSNENNISFMWCTDGVRIFKSSKFSIWGFFLVILELPYEDRYKLENMLLVLLWFGDNKPMPNLFLEPLRHPLRQVYKGIDFFVKDLDSVLNIRGIIICGTADLPAKSLFLEMNQHNGRFGCTTCVQDGLTVERRRTYPYIENLILRAENDVEKCAAEALECGNPVCGVKGPAMLSKICHKFITSAAIYVLHAVFEGVAKKLGELWFDKKYKDHDFNISSLIEVVDFKLCNIKPPMYVNRRPRPIKTHWSYYKGSELKCWFFYYSLPVLEGILDQKYIDHFMKIVIGVYILCQSKITNHMVDLAEELIEEFSRQFEDLYEAQHMTSQKKQKMESYFVSYNENQTVSIGLVDHYIRVTNCMCQKLCECRGKNYACVKKITTVTPFSVNISGVELKYMHKSVEVCNDITLVKLKYLKDV